MKKDSSVAMHTSSPESDQKIWTKYTIITSNEVENLHAWFIYVQFYLHTVKMTYYTVKLHTTVHIMNVLKYISNKSWHFFLLTHMFGLDFNAADQFCVFPVIESQSIDWPYSQKKTSINACDTEGKRSRGKNNNNNSLLETTRQTKPQKRNEGLLPSAPKSGLKDFFSLKFLKILTMLLLSRMAYLFF